MYYGRGYGYHQHHHHHRGYYNRGYYGRGGYGQSPFGLVFGYGGIRPGFVLPTPFRIPFVFPF